MAIKNKNSLKGKLIDKNIYISNLTKSMKSQIKVTDEYRLTNKELRNENKALMVQLKILLKYNRVLKLKTLKQ